MSNFISSFIRKKIVGSLLKDVVQENREFFYSLQKQIQQIQVELQKNYDKLSATEKTVEAVQTEIMRPRGIFSAADSFVRNNPEAALLGYLYSHLPCRSAIDIGAHRGEISTRLLAAGYEVYALEPNPSLYQALKKQLEGNGKFHLFPYAAGSEDGTKTLSFASSQGGELQDATLLSTVLESPTSANPLLSYQSKIQVEMRSLESMRKSGLIPQQIGCIKVDTEGYDLYVLRGMGAIDCPVVSTEFWAEDFSFRVNGASNTLLLLVEEMRRREYHWHLVIFRRFGSDLSKFFIGATMPPSNTWGTVFFFRDQNLFETARKWSDVTLDEEYCAF
jgi:FkbM family methyltransferase